MRERLALVCVLALLLAGAASAQTGCPPGQEPYAPLPGRCVPRDTVRERLDGLLQRHEGARSRALAWLREHGVDSAALAVNAPLDAGAAFTDERIVEQERAAGWPSLRLDTLATHREIRVRWSTFGTVSLRLRRFGNHVEGELLGSPDGPVGVESPQCQRVFQADDGDLSCVFRFSPEPDWRRVWERLDSAGAWMLPDEAALPAPADLIQFDGAQATVELRSGAHYRRYRLEGLADGVDAALHGLGRIVMDVYALRFQPPIQAFRGHLWRESNRIRFRTCEPNAGVWSVAGLPLEASLLPASATAAAPLGALLDGRTEPRGPESFDDDTAGTLYVERLVRLDTRSFCR